MTIASAIDELVEASLRRRCAEADAVGLHRVDLHALKLVAGDSSMTPTELASALSVSSSGLTAIVDRLARAQLVVRRPGPDARRRILLRITTEGALLLASVRDASDAARQLEPEQEALLLAALRRMSAEEERRTDVLRQLVTSQAAASAAPQTKMRWG